MLLALVGYLFSDCLCVSLLRQERGHTRCDPSEDVYQFISCVGVEMLPIGRVGY